MVQTEAVEAFGTRAPDTHDNQLKVSAGDRVFDFGVDNVVKAV